MKKVIISVLLPDGYEDYIIKSVSILKIDSEIDYKRLPIKIVEIPNDNVIDDLANGEMNKPHLDRFDCGAKWLKYIIENS